MKNVSAKTVAAARADRVADADLVVVAGTIGPAPSWTRGLLRSLLPVLGTTPLERLLGGFTTQFAGESTICANGDTKTISAYLDRTGLAGGRLKYYADPVPRGTAGCLKACSSNLGGRPFFLAHGSVWLDDDFSWMLQRHKEAGNTVTVFCRPLRASAGDDSRHALPAGVFCCEPEVLEFIPGDGFFDFKEQLIPRLLKAGHRVGAVTMRGRTREIQNWSDYLDTVTSTMLDGMAGAEAYDTLAPNIRAGHGTQIHETARVFGPVVLGADCRIEAEAVVVGPVVLGDGSRVGRKAWVSRVVAATAVNVPDASQMVDQLVYART